MIENVRNKIQFQKFEKAHIDIVIKLIILIHLKKSLYSAKKNFVTYFLFKTKQHF